MAKKPPKLPPSPETREHVLAVIRSSPQPLQATAIVKLLVEPHQLTAKELAPILDEYVAAGSLLLLPPKKASGKPQYWDRDPAALARPAILEALQQANAPLSADDIARRLPAPLAFKAADLAPWLDELAMSGTIQKFAPTTAKGKLKFWDRDPGALARPAILEALQQAEAPLSPEEIAKQLPTPLAFKAADLLPWLDELANGGAVHRFPATTAKGKPRFGNRSPIEYGRLALRKLLETKGPQPEKSLRTALKQFSDELYRQIVDAAIAARELWRHPVAGKVKVELLGSRPASPERYLSDVGSQLAKIVSPLLAAGIPHDDLRRSLVQLIEAAGIPFSASSYATNSTTTHREAPSESAPAAVDLIALIRRLEPGADRGALVVTRDLRRAAGLEKTRFDHTVLDLARQGRLSLHRHDYPASLTSTERDELVTDGNGTYFVGVALRQS